MLCPTLQLRTLLKICLRNLPNWVKLFGKVITLTRCCRCDNAPTIASTWVVLPEESIPSTTTNGALFGCVVLGSLRLDGFISISNNFQVGIRSDHPVNMDMTVLSPELVCNCSSPSQRLPFPIVQHSRLQVLTPIPKCGGRFFLSRLEC